MHTPPSKQQTLSKGRHFYREWMAVLGFGLVCLAGCNASVATPSEASIPADHTELIIYNYDTFIDPSLLADFEQLYDVSITYEIYSNADELHRNLVVNPTKYDVIVPPDEMILQMRTEGLLAPLNKANIPNFKNIASDFVNPAHDPGNRYCAPYLWGTGGIGYNSELTGREIDSWGDFFDPAFKGQVALLDEPRNSLGLALLYLGYSLNSADIAQIYEARDLLISHIDQVATFAPDTGQDLLRDGEVAIVNEWNGDMLQVMADHPELHYVIPKEGSIIWIDGLCIPQGAPHKELAEIFINYILSPEAGARLANFTQFASPNQAAFPLINALDRSNPLIYPSEDIMKRLYYEVNPGADTENAYRDAWEQVKAAWHP